MQELKSIIEAEYLNISSLSPENISLSLQQTLNSVMHHLNHGSLRVTSKENGNWTTATWLKQAVLLLFKSTSNKKMAGFNQFYDKVELKFNAYTDEQLQQSGVRIVPPACIRDGVYIGPKTVLMPSYVNIGAYIDSGCMIDTWATVGSCAHIGKNVHLSGGAGIGGVLEPINANPTIIEDNCFIGARSEIAEGVIIKEGSVISMGVYIGKSTPIYDTATDTISYGVIPAGSVVIPGTVPGKNSNYNKYAAIIVKRVDEQTRSKVSINDILREA